MLIEFSFGNYKSFKDEATLSMVANNRLNKNKHNVIKTKRCNLLKSAALYGANGSGKSNVVKAIEFASHFIKNSLNLNDKINIEPFLLNTDSENLPSFFEFVIIRDDVKYRYGFSVTTEKVVSEWFYKAVNGDEEVTLFTRDEDGIYVEFEEGRELESKTRANALFLSVVANFNGKDSIVFLNYINTQLTLYQISDNFEHYTSIFLGLESLKDEFLKIIKKIDFSIKDVTKANAGGTFDKAKIKTLHAKYNKNLDEVENVEFDLVKHESEGTNRLFAILGLIQYVLLSGGLLIMDEIDLKLHPLLVEFLIRYFNSAKYNKNNAQLIFTTHNTNLLRYNILRKDQIWLTDKNRYEETTLYSLNDFKDLNDDEKLYYIDYLLGRYRAIPMIDFEEIFGDESSEKKLNSKK